MINVLNLDNEIVMQLTEADITKLLRVAREAKEMLEKMDGVSCVGGYFVDDIREALKEVEHLLPQIQ